MKKIIISIIISFMLCGCSSNDVTSPSYKEIMQQNEYVIVDVRTSEEYDSGHIKDAVNIPYDEIEENVNLSKDKTIFVYCKSGVRSSIAYETLSSLGYTVYDLGAYESIDLEKE